MDFRRHPRTVELEAWFDGERDAGVGGHVARCERCRSRVDEVARLRAVLRGAFAAVRPAADRGTRRA